MQFKKMYRIISKLVQAALIFILIFSITDINYNKNLAQTAFFADGDGSRNNPYQITTVQELENISTFTGISGRGVYFKLMNDLDMSSEKNFIPLGTFTGYGNIDDSQDSFQGVFDGNYKTIRNLTVNDNNHSYQGLFGVQCTISGPQSVIKNLILENVSINGRFDNGGIVGYSFNSVIAGCSVNGSVSGGGRTGGITGESKKTIIMNCDARVNVSGQDYTGGLTGINSDEAVIADSYVKEGSVTGNNYTGGLAGYNKTDAIITNSYASDSVDGNDYTGGISGFSYGKIIGTAAFNSHISAQTSECYKIGYSVQTGPNNYLKDNYSSNDILVSGEYKSGETDNSGFNGAGISYDVISNKSFYEGIGWDMDYTWSISQTAGMPVLGANSSATGFDSGDGSRNNPYLIATPQQMLAMRSFMFNDSVYFKLKNDLNFNNSDILHNAGLFILSGIFDGAGNSITGLNITSTKSNYTGLFDAIILGGEVKNLNIKNMNMNSVCITAGGIAGYNSGYIHESTVSGNITGSRYIGGITGINFGTVKISSSAVNIQTSSDNAAAGGIAHINKGIITDSYCTGSATCTGQQTLAGGIAAKNEGNILNCFSSGTYLGTSSNPISDSSGNISGSFNLNSGNDKNELSQSKAYILSNWDFINTWIYPDNSLTPVFKNTKRSSFPDIRPNESFGWASDYIEVMAGLNIINGSSDINGKVLFKPGSVITRAEFTTLLVRVLNINDDNASSNFTDVPSDSWFYKYVSSAVSKGLINGTGNGAFSPGLPITRQDMSVIISRAFKNLYGVPDLDVQSINEILDSFVDKNDISDYAKIHVANVVNYKLMIGSADNGKLVFNPLSNAKRAEAATLIYRIYYSQLRNTQ